MGKIRCAIYCRLSRDDGTSDESSSIKTQKDALTKYALEHNYEIHDIYVDDGFTGTNFNRPSFKRMIDDIEAHRFQVLLTKDLSRLSRNYLQAGYYMEDYFPKNNIRYIAVNDNYDSNNDNNEFALFKNIINEWYAKDISKKVKFAFNNMVKQGIIPIGGTALYGYNYDEKRNRVINPDTAPIVLKIFELYKEYQSSLKISAYLKENKIYCPGYTFYLQYGTNSQKYANCDDDTKYNWPTGVINRMLRNEEYTGKLILNKTKNEKLGGKKGIRTSEDERVYFDDRFPGIISSDLFHEVGRLLDRNKNSTVTADLYKLKGMLVCESCRQAMILFRKGFYRCNCRTCHAKATFNIEAVNAALARDVLSLKAFILAHENELIEYAKTYSKSKSKKTDKNEKEYKRLKAKLNQIDIYIQKLFEGNLNNQMPISTYNLMMSKYKEEHSQIEKGLVNLAPVKFEMNYEEYLHEFIENIKKIDETNVLENRLLLTIIEKITLHKEMVHHNYGNIIMTIHYYKLGGLLEDFINEKRITR